METRESAASKTADNRRARRRQVLKRAQLILGSSGSTIDCLVLNESEFGVNLETSVMSQVPERLRVRFADGATREARRLWARGNQLGLEFEGRRITKPDAALALQTRGMQAAVAKLRELEVFEGDDLRAAAEAAELALARLTALLE
jgi:hypothetical protein